MKKDERMKLTNEVVTGIKYVKMSGWEEAFMSKVRLRKRLEEAQSLTRWIS